MLKDVSKRILGRNQRNYVDEYEVPIEEAKGTSDLFKLFRDHKGRLIHKWVHYLDLYDRHFAKFRGPVKMLEIGVFQGGSLELWRKYMGPEATIYGVDIDPSCAQKFDPPNQVRIGSQDDSDFLKSVVGEMGGIDIVLDDGSHIGRHQEASFRTLFPLLSYGGIYAIEDTHSSYWNQHYEGGYRKPGTAIEFVKTLIDDMHHWWHDRDGAEIGAIHIYDSIIFIEKAKQTQPQVVKTG